MMQCAAAMLVMQAKSDVPVRIGVWVREVFAVITHCEQKLFAKAMPVDRPHFRQIGTRND